MLWVQQAFFGWLLVLAAISLNRMGPAFKRSKFATPVFLLGFAIIMLTENPDGVSESCTEQFCTENTYLEFHNFIINSSIWITFGVLGIILVIKGSEWYSKSNLIALIFGWLLILYSWWTVLNMEIYDQIFEQPSYLTNYLFFILGVIISSFTLIYVVRWTEINTPRDIIIEEMDERARNRVTEIIRRNIEVDN